MKWIKNKWVITSLLLLGIFSAVLVYHHLTAKKDKVKYGDYSTKVDKIDIVASNFKIGEQLLDNSYQERDAWRSEN